MGGWGSQLQGGLPSLLTWYGVTWYARFRAARVVPSCVDFWRGGRHPRRPNGPSGPCGHAVDPMTRRSLVSCSPTSRATALPDIAETKALTRASNSKVKPPPSRAHGTLIFLTPHLSQRARGTRACSPLLVTVHGGASRSRLVSRMSVSPHLPGLTERGAVLAAVKDAVCAALRWPGAHSSPRVPRGDQARTERRRSAEPKNIG